MTSTSTAVAPARLMRFDNASAWPGLRVSARTARLAPQPGAVPLPRPLTTALTPREAEVLRLIAAGRLTKQVAHELSISPYTVNNHIARIYEKTGARNRAAAAIFAHEHGLLAVRV